MVESDIARWFGRGLRWAAEGLAVTAATALAGALGVAAFFSLISLAEGESPATFLRFMLDLWPLLLLVPFVVTAAAIPLLALPAMALLRRIEAETLPAYAGAGGGGGALLSIPLDGGGGVVPAGYLLLICAAYGAIAGGLFYLICRRSRRAPFD